MSIVDGTQRGLRASQQEVLDLRDLLNYVQGYNGEHAFSDPQRVPRGLHELLPDYEVQHKQDDYVAREQDRVLAVPLVEVVED